MHLHTVLMQDTSAFNLQLQMHYYGFDISNIKLWILIFKIIKLALNLAAQVSVSQRGPERTTPADIYLQQQNMSSFYKSSLDAHVCLDNERSLEQVLSVQWFLFIKREMSCPGTCAVPFLCHPTCVGAHDFSHAPPVTGSWSPPVPPH